MRETTLFVTHCSGKKNGTGGPLTLYTSPRVQRFGNACKSTGVRWAILSAEHGLFLPSESHDPYDTALHFSGGECFIFKGEPPLLDPESKNHIKSLIGRIGNSLKQVSIHRVVFYVGGAPQRVCSYLLVMHQALNNCTKKHDSPNDVLNCIKNTSSFCIASSLAELEEEIQKIV